MASTTAPRFCPHCDRPESALLVDDTDHWACHCGGHGHLSQLVELEPTEQVSLRFDRLVSGERVAIHQGIAAIVFRPAAGRVRWTLAGEPWADEDPFAGDTPDRPSGDSATTDDACLAASLALGQHLGVEVTDWVLA